MPSQIMVIRNAEDLPQMNGWMIDKCYYDNGTINLLISNILAPNKVNIKLFVDVNMQMVNNSLMQINRQIRIETEDVPK
jgi:hypothetical protein